MHASILNRMNHSSHMKVGQGVPQGSVLEPILFTLYMFPLSIIINLSIHESR